MRVHHWKTFQVTKIKTCRSKGEKKKNHYCRHNINLNVLVSRANKPKVYQKQCPCKLPTQILRVANVKLFLQPAQPLICIYRRIIFIYHWQKHNHSYKLEHSLACTVVYLGPCRQKFKLCTSKVRKTIRFVYVVMIAPCQTSWCNRPLLMKNVDKTHEWWTRPSFSSQNNRAPGENVHYVIMHYSPYELWWWINETYYRLADQTGKTRTFQRGELDHDCIMLQSSVTVSSFLFL